MTWSPHPPGSALPLSAGLGSWGSVKPQPGVKRLAFPAWQKSPEEQGSCTFEVLLSDHLKCKRWNGFRSLIRDSHQTSGLCSGSKGKLHASLIFAGGSLGLLVPCVSGRGGCAPSLPERTVVCKQRSGLIQHGAFSESLPPSARADTRTACAAVPCWMN